MKKNSLRESVICTFVFALTLTIGLIACGGKAKINLPGIPPIGSTLSHLLISGPQSSSHIQPNNGNKVVASSLAFFQVSTPTLSQTFDALCTFSVNTTTIPVGSFVPIPIHRNGGDCNHFQAALEPKSGAIVHDAGTVTTIVVDANLSDGSSPFCKLLTGTDTVADLDRLQPYLDPNTGQVFIGDGTTKLGTSCTITIPAGTSVQDIEVQWVK